VEVNRVDEVLDVPEFSRRVLHPLNLRVHRLTCGVRNCDGARRWWWCSPSGA